jgi:prepilin-type N-terminal cleavage/methylation domain-containing protein
MVQLPRHRSASRTGMTLTELVVVLVILAVLAAVAIPSFVSASHETVDQTVKQNLRGLALAENNWYAIHGSFADTTASLAELDHSFTFVSSTSASTGPGQVSYASSTSTTGYPLLTFAALSNTGTCFTITQPPPPSGGSEVTADYPASQLPCDGQEGATQSGSAW